MVDVVWDNCKFSKITWDNWQTSSIAENVARRLDATSWEQEHFFPLQFSVIFQEKDYQLLNDLITSLGEDICWPMINLGLKTLYRAKIIQEECPDFISTISVQTTGKTITLTLQIKNRALQVLANAHRLSQEDLIILAMKTFKSLEATVISSWR